MSFSVGKYKFNKVFDRSDFHVNDPLTKVNIVQKGGNLILGGNPKTDVSSLAYLGKVIENSPNRNLLSHDVWLDIDFPHVIYITGTRGSGKSFDLGVLLEGISKLKEESPIQENVEPICSILVDTQSQFWTLNYPPNPSIPSNKTQLELLDKWNISSNQLDNCKLWRVSDEDKITGDENILSIKPSLVKHEEWCEILGIEVYGPQGYSLRNALDNVQRIDFEIEDLITYIRNPGHLNNIQESSRSSLVYKLREYQDSGLFSSSGLKIEDFLEPGRCNILLLRALRDIDKSLIVCVIARQLFTFMGKYHKEKKINAFFARSEEFRKLPNKVWLMIDEAHVVAPSNSPSPAREALVEYVKRGRDAGLSLVLATQQPSAIDDRILSQVNLSFSHRLAFQSDINASVNRIPTKPVRHMKVAGVDFSDFGDMMRFLDAGQCFIGDSGTSRTVLAQIRPRVTSHGGYAPS